MSHPRFKDLQEKLLRAGIAPRHVRRYLGELRQHYDDLDAEENEAGVSGVAAEQAASARLGSDSELTAAMLSQPELRSISARYPWAVFGIGSAVFLSASLFFATLAEVGFIRLYELIAGRVWPHWLQSLFTAWDMAMM